MLSPKIKYLLYLADNALILGHRNSEWCGHGPILEQDIALTNISLDLVGQARNFYQYAASEIGNDTTEDSLAYLRDVREFRNCLITELPNGDWGQTILRQFFFSTYQYFLYTALKECADEQLAAIAEKSLKEVTYHVRWSSEWVIRLGDGTAESHQRMRTALDNLWNYTGEMLMPSGYEKEMTETLAISGTDGIAEKWHRKINEVLEEATLAVPESTWSHQGGKEGLHTEHLGYILAEMQFLQRAYPGAEW